jgi:acyl-CoA reductase-like NAD-dependent aldehyde dehydrogenase
MADVRPYLVAGEWKTGSETFDIESPYDGATVATVGKPTEDEIEAAMAGAAAVFEETRKLPIYRRAEALVHISKRIEERAHEIAELIAREGGKPLKWAQVETTRAVSTFQWAAEEVRRFGGEIMRLDTDESLGSRMGLVRRFPLGPVLGITPFNFPVNLVAHKLAPSLAVGAPIVIKPASQTPLGALFLAELFLETDLPKEMVSVLTLGGSESEVLVKDDRFAKVSFTGSDTVGWSIKRDAPKKAVTLELGGNAGALVHSDADLDVAAARVAFGGYYQSGQSCISVQRTHVHESIFEDFKQKLLAEIGKLKTGDPLDPETDIGPLIDRDAVERIGSWVDEATQEGAEVLIGGKREDPFYHPTVLTNTKPEMKVCKQEIFGPVITLEQYSGFSDAIAELNNSRYGLQAGVFTNDMNRILEAHRDLQVGGIIVNDVPSFRADQMPYGGSKESGSGREGLRWAIEEMTEPRVLVLSHVPL